jgi:hypothetical protein
MTAIAKLRGRQRRHAAELTAAEDADRRSGWEALPGVDGTRHG